MRSSATNPPVGAAFLVALIDAYQRYVSPHKGFRCAHRVLHGGASCSGFAKHVLLRNGPRWFLPLMRRRFAACAAAASELSRRSILDKEKRDDEANDRGATGRGCRRHASASDWLDLACCGADEAACTCWN